MIVAVLALPLLGVGDLAKHQTIFAMNQEQVDQALLRPARWPRLVLLRSDYRVMHEPLLKLIKQLADASPGRPLAVLLPEVVKTVVAAAAP